MTPSIEQLSNTLDERRNKDEQVSHLTAAALVESLSNNDVKALYQLIGATAGESIALTDVLISIRVLMEAKRESN
ncbi:hypothetical protein [Vibrio agarivorans]|uniref:DNA ligase n=1 Tax=Vibrio agarivorans TaxID=153622 RepID=A0ABT7Y753_9VIBR|nr:hypothetical protein [Vibrio agarivorans]MDN2483882.1 hypothetical protein [Vibrio agarivorans]